MTARLELSTGRCQGRPPQYESGNMSSLAPRRGPHGSPTCAMTLTASPRVGPRYRIAGSEEAPALTVSTSVRSTAPLLKLSTAHARGPSVSCTTVTPCFPQPASTPNHVRVPGAPECAYVTPRRRIQPLRSPSKAHRARSVIHTARPLPCLLRAAVTGPLVREGTTCPRRPAPRLPFSG